MKIKYSPVKHNPAVNTDVAPDSVIEVIDANTLSVDGTHYEFDTDSVQWEGDELREATNGRVTAAHRDDSGELYVTVRRYYTQTERPEWDTGDYHEVTV